MKTLTSVFDWISKIMLYIAMAVFAIVIALVVVNIVGRSFFHFTIGGIVEVVQYGMLVVMSFALARTCFNNGHVIVSIILDKFPGKARGIVACVELCIAALVFAMATYVAGTLIPDAFASGRVTDVYKIPYYLVYVVLSFGMAVSALTFIYKGIEAAYTAFHPQQKKDAE